MIRRVAWTALISALAVACAEPAHDRARRPIVGGAESNEVAAVALLGHVGASTYLCSGALISPRVVLTAAHCVDGRDGIDAVFGADINDPGSIVATIPASYWEAHPDWDDTPFDLFDQHYDVGLVLLGSDAPAQPLAVSHTALSAGELDAAMRLLGYGDTSNGAYDSGTRLEASTTLREYDDWWTTAGDQTGTTCVGDSGGPQLMTLGGAEVIVGVTSFGTAPPGESLCQFDTIAARVDIVAADFIDPFIAEHDPPEGAPDAGADPEPDASGGADAGAPGGDDPGEDGGGCSTGQHGGGWPFALLVTAGLAVRRRLRFMRRA